MRISTKLHLLRSRLAPGTGKLDRRVVHPPARAPGAREDADHFWLRDQMGTSDRFRTKETSDGMGGGHSRDV